MKSRILIGLLLNLFATFVMAATWQLPTGYFVPAKMPMTVVFPRPDAETNTWARQRLAYADGSVQYRIPISIQGGAYPFHFDLISGPTGMTIGQDITDTDYGIVTWTPATSDISPTAYNVTVKVTDQDLNTTNVTWSVTATTSGFVFVDPNAATNGNGTKANPFNTAASLFVTKGNTSPYFGSIIYFRSGTTNISGPDYNSGTGNAITCRTGQNPCVWLGYPGEKAVLDFSNAQVAVDNQDDVFIGGLNFKNANSAVPNSRFFLFSTYGAENRITFFEDNFDTISLGSVGNDNPSAITIYEPTSLRNYFTLVGCTYINYSAPMLHVYAVKYGVIENNTIYAGNTSSVGQGFMLKSDVQNFSVRHNTSVSQTFTSGAIETYLQAGNFPNDNIEISYNLLIDPSTNSNNHILNYNWTSSQGVNINPKIYIYRNTLIGTIGGLDYFPYTVYLEDNVMVNAAGDIGNTSGTYRKIIDTSNITGKPSDGMTDIDGNLIGTASQYRGTHGHLISVGVNPLNAPAWN